MKAKQKLTELAVVVAAVGSLAAAAGPAAANLTKKQQEVIVRQVVPVYQQGNPVLLLETLSPIVAKLNPDSIEAADKLIAEHGLPPIMELLADARMALAEQNLADKMPAPNSRELLLTLAAFDERIQAVLRDQDRHPVMADLLAAPEKLDDYTELFWEIHVLDNRLAGADRVAQYAAKLSEFGRRLNRKSLTAAETSLLDKDFPQVIDDIRRRRQELEEREIELRMHRIEESAYLLATSQSSRLRFLAAYALDLDGELIDQFYQERDASNGTPYIRRNLAEPLLRTDIRAAAVRGRQSAGPVLEKTRLLYTGLHWWSRGRYGAGPLARGLMKSPAALTSEQAQFPLYMPLVPPKPSDPAAVGSRTASVPQVDRRHHYTWAIEYRPFATTTSHTSRTVGTSRFVGPGTEQTTHLSRFY